MTAARVLWLPPSEETDFAQWRIVTRLLPSEAQRAFCKSGYYRA